MKIGIYSLSLHDKRPEEIVEIAQKYHCDGIEWWCREKGHIDIENLDSSVKEILKVMKGSGLETPGIAPYFKFNETRKDVKTIFNVAGTLGAKIIRCHSYSFINELPVTELMKRQRVWLEDVIVPVAGEFGIKLVIEQHHLQICCTPNACRQLVEGLPVDRVGIIYDPGNSLFDGYTTSEYALDIIGEYLAHVHVKSCKPAAEGGNIPKGRRYPMEWGKLEDGDLDWENIIMLLQQRGYAGYLSLEALDKRESEQKVKEDIPYLRKILKKASTGGIND
jgi:sugar phosphate isomerase/epimerase